MTGPNEHETTLDEPTANARRTESERGAPLVPDLCRIRTEHLTSTETTHTTRPSPKPTEAEAERDAPLVPDLSGARPASSMPTTPPTETRRTTEDRTTTQEGR
ncbi:MAG: hypothetical protein ABEI27_07795 [Halobellus sp.]|uniref:hypothetical protein n=1 Tax=Halobellus sp. TaxID=1979212 RepID=UPI0035D419AC